MGIGWQEQMDSAIMVTMKMAIHGKKWDIQWKQWF